jgi:SAM-dependent methyltransferase
MVRPAWAPQDIDLDRPSGARVYDYFLGGAHNFAVDRELAEAIASMTPDIGDTMRANRSFLRRVVRYLVGQGITQFLDIGSGIPTLGNVHEVAQEASPDARVVYVDIDPIAVEQSRSLLDGNPYARVVQGDLREPEAVLTHPEVAGLLDFSRPVAVLTVAVFHFVPDSANPAGIVERLGHAMVPGSYLVLSHAGPDESPEGRAAQETARKLYERTPTPLVVRYPDEIAEMVGDGFEIVEPGVVAATDWHPDPDEAGDPPQPTALVAVARKR